MCRSVLITGASRGIGKAISEKMVLDGYEVYAPDSKVLDLSSKESINNYIDKYKSKTFDVIINNAGCNDTNLIEHVTDEEIQKMILVNMIAPMKLIRGFIEQMKKNHYGRIVNIGSIWANVSKPGRCVYAATKNGIHGITNTIALEGASYNILVNTVCPGFTMTELTLKNNTESQISQICEDIPLGRMAKPKEIADLICYLASEKNTYITGQKITIDGGYTIK